MRVGIVALLQESNTFIRQPTTLAEFERDMLLRGAAVERQLAGAHHEVGGFFEGLAAAGIEAVPIFAARAVPFGIITAEAFDTLLAMLFESLDEAQRTGPLDGILAAAHGATVSQVHCDADGHWLSLLRDRIGPDMPLICTIDPHANASPRMVAACDATIAYRTNPHIDQRACGRAAADLMAATLRGEVAPTQALAAPPMAINIERQLTAEPPCCRLYEAARAIEQNEAVLSTSIVLGFPYADVPEMGSSAIVVTNGDRELAQQLADELAATMWAMRAELAGEFISVDEAIDRAAKLDGPVCLLDMGDNVGGGAPADSTVLAHALVECTTAAQPGFICLYDPEAVRAATAAGIGATVSLRMGGHAPDSPGPPLERTCIVEHLCDGVYDEPQPRHGGFTRFDQGTTAIVRTSHLTIMLTTLRAAPYSLQQLIACGVDPARFHFIVAKGVHAPVAAYASACKHFIRVNTPGITCADMTLLHYAHRRRPMYPFERDTVWHPATPIRSLP